MRDTLMIRINDNNNTQFVKYDDGRFTKWYYDNDKNGTGGWIDYDNAYEFSIDAIKMITDNSDLFYTIGGKAKPVKSEDILDLALNLYKELRD